MDTLQLRRAGPEDAAAIAALVASPADLYQVAPGESHPLSAEVVAHWLRSREGGLVLLADQQIVAHAELNRDAEQKHVWWISHVVVHPRQRRRGLGRELILRTVQHAKRECGARAIWLSVFADNPSGVHTYRRAGFRLGRKRLVEGRPLLDLFLDLQAEQRSISRRGVAMLGACGGVLSLALLPGELRAALIDEQRWPWWWLLAGAGASAAGAALALRRLLPRRSARGVAPLLRPLLFGLTVGLVLALAWSAAAPLVRRGASFDLFGSLNLGLQFGAGWGLVCAFVSQLALRLHQLPASGPAIGQEFLPR